MVHALSHKLPIGYNWAPHIRPQNYLLPSTHFKIQPLASSLYPSDLPSQMISISDQPFCHSALDIQTDTQTNRWLEGMFDDYRLLSLYRERQCSLIIASCCSSDCSGLHHLRARIIQLYLTDGATVHPDLKRGFSGPCESASKRLLDRFSHFCRAQLDDQCTDTGDE